MALIPPTHLNTVACIGVPESDGTVTWSASGFFYGDLVNGEKGKKGHRVYLVTNRHVFLGKRQVVVRLNTQGSEPAKEFEVELIREDDSRIWFAPQDEEIDLALIHVDAPSFSKQGIEFGYFRGDQDVLPRAEAQKIGVTEGDGVFCLGFPLGMVGGERNFVIVRQGVIARISDTLAGSTNEFLLDVLIFPGNSGGPVIIRPEAVAIEGTSKIPGSFLIGVVKGYVPYQDVAISMQTHRPRITFEENSGLAAAVPIDFVKEAIDEYIAAHLEEGAAA